MSFWCHHFDQNNNQNIVSIFALIFFVTSWGLPGSFLGLFGDFLCNIIVYKEGYRKPQKVFRKCQGRYKNFKGRNPNNIFVAILVETMTQKRHFEINWPLVENNTFKSNLSLLFWIPKSCFSGRNFSRNLITWRFLGSDGFEFYEIFTT